MRIKSFKLFESVSKEFTKDGKNYEIVYTGDKDPNQDGFLIHFTGYDDAIGNKIIGFFDFGSYPDALENEELKKIMDESKNAITSGFSYCNANDIIDLYTEFCKEMDVRMIPQYKERLKPFGFDIMEK